MSIEAQAKICGGFSLIYGGRLPTFVMKDQRLIGRFLDGDAAATQKVRNWIRSVVARWPGLLDEDGEDLEQTILVELLTNLRGDRFQKRSSLKTYVRSWAHHKCIDRIRARKRRTFTEIDDEGLVDPRAPSSDDLVDRDQSRRLLRLLHQMPENCRILWSYLEEGLSYREMSERLGVSEGALRVRVTRCRQKAQEMRQRFEEL